MNPTSMFTARVHRVALLLALLAAVAAGSAARAERLLFQRGDALYAAGADGKNARRLFAPGKAEEGIGWAPSPDGRRLAWFAPLPLALDAPAPDTGASAGLAARPVAVYLSDLGGQRRKRLLATNNLRDRQGRKVTTLFVGNEVPTENGASSLADWALDTLAWSADGRSLYLSCTFLPTVGGRATFVVDAATGACVVDGQGRWKNIAGMTQVDARGPLLVGVGLERTSDEGVVPNAESKFAPLTVTNLAEGKTVSLLPATFSSKRRPPYATALAPALSPDARRIVFAALGQGLYLVDTQGKAYRRLTTSPGDDQPRWSLDGKRILFLSAPTDAASPSAADLCEIDVRPSGTPPRRLVLANVDRFFVVPD